MKNIRQDFPLINNSEIIYFDNGATTQKPQSVIKREQEYYSQENSNIHRGIHQLSYAATENYEKTRVAIQQYINAKSAKEIIFTKGTTQSINLVAFGYALYNLKPDDEILITRMEHHANIVPWQIIAQKTKAKLVYVNLKDFKIDLEDFKNKLNDKTKIISFTHISNVLGTINPVEKMIRIARENTKATIIIDAAQSIHHEKIDVQKLDVDFLAFSAHKMYGPTGVGVLYGKYDLLTKTEPFEYGGDMINIVEENCSTWAEIPAKFEGGTPNISGVISFKESIEYINNLGLDNIKEEEQQLTKYFLDKLSAIPQIEIYGTKDIKTQSSVISFNIKGLHPHDLATFLDENNIAIRTGHHCAQILMKDLQQPATARVSLSFYNEKEEIDIFIEKLQLAIEFFGIE